jgi:hypothetical protein
VSSPSSIDSDVLAPYRAIIEHAEMELELAGNGDVEGLAALAGHWDELVAGLPATPPGNAGQLLERAQLLHERTRVELIRLRDTLLADFATARRAQRTAAGYGEAHAAGRRLNRSA